MSGTARRRGGGAARADRRRAARRHPALRLLQRAGLVCRPHRDARARSRPARADRPAIRLFADRPGRGTRNRAGGEALGLGLVPWSPLAAGLLTGKYGRDKLEAHGPPAPCPTRPTGRATAADGSTATTRSAGCCSPSATSRWWTWCAARHRSDARWRMVALAWVTQRPGVSSVLIGASRPDQVHANVASLDVTLSDDQRARLDAVSALPMINTLLHLPDPARAALRRGVRHALALGLHPHAPARVRSAARPSVSITPAPSTTAAAA